MKKLFVIGNGFDQAHGLKTSYNDFKEYLRKNCNEYFWRVKKYNKLNGNALWSDFENNLSKIDVKKLFLQIKAVDSIKEKSELNGDWTNDDKSLDVDYELDYYKELTFHLYDWVKAINYNKKRRVKNISAFDDACFLSFNYTLTLEKFYGIKDSNICHIHGSIKDIHTKLIIGHGSDDDSLDLLEKYGSDDRLYTVYICVGNYLANTKKPVQSIIKEKGGFFSEHNNIDEIYIIGHSLSDVDLPYIEKIIDDSPNAIVYVTYYNSDDKDKFENIIKKYTKNYEICKFEDIIKIE